MKPYPSFFLAAFLVLLPGFGPSQDLPELKKLRFEFQVELAEANQPLRELTEKYRGYLEKLKTDYQNAGNLKGVQAVDEAIEGEPGDETSSFPELARLQKIYRQQETALLDDPESPRVGVMRQYRKKAEGLAAGWTKEGKTKKAKRALAESERFAAMREDPSLVMTITRPATEVISKLTETPSPQKDKGNVRRKPGEEKGNGLGMKLCWIPAGEFLMGSPKTEVGRDSANETQVEVELAGGFWIGKFEVTQGEYETMMGNNPSRFMKVGKRGPVEHVNWDEAMAFCAKLTKKERKSGRLPEGWVYTLPTEAQWEFACRAGEPGPFSGGEPEEVAWNKDNSSGSTHPVGKKKRNAWGLHDMHGNVREWCADWFATQLGGGVDPAGPVTGSLRVVRGGGRYYGPSSCRAASRIGLVPSYRNFLGFRVCLSPAR